MTQNKKYFNGNNFIIISFIVLSMLLQSPALFSQSLTDFSGVWIQDTAKSDDFYKDFIVTYTITQTPQLFTVKPTFLDKAGKEISSRINSFNLDGKEVSKEEQGGIDKESAKWSPDKKILTTKSTRTVGTDIYGSTSSYSLSGNVLTVITSDINEGGPSVKLVFNRK